MVASAWEKSRKHLSGNDRTTIAVAYDKELANQQRPEKATEIHKRRVQASRR